MAIFWVKNSQNIIANYNLGPEIPDLINFCNTTNFFLPTGNNNCPQLSVKSPFPSVIFFQA